MNTPIKRLALLSRVTESLRNYPVTLILGPRQCGKTTLARELCNQANGYFFDLENPQCPIQEESAAHVLTGCDFI
jgi:predicted AAA+ superfamily ATPase